MKLFILIIFLHSCFATFVCAQAKLPNLTVKISYEIQDTDEYLLDSPISISMYADGRYAIAEQRHAKVFVFSSDHRLEQEIGRRGNGPGEFQIISHVALLGGRLVVFDRQLMRVSLFDAANGKLLLTRSYRDFFNANLQPLHVSVIQFNGKPFLSVATARYTYSGAEADLDFVRWYDSELNRNNNENYHIKLDYNRLFESNKQALKANFFSPINNLSTFYSNNIFLVIPHIYEGKLQGISVPTNEYIDYVEPFRLITKPPYREFDSREAMQRDVERNNFRYKYISQSGSNGTIRIRIESYSLGIVRKDGKLFHIVGLETATGYQYKYSRYNAMTMAFEGTGDVVFESPSTAGGTNPMIHQVFPSIRDGSFVAAVLVERELYWVVYQY